MGPTASAAIGTPEEGTMSTIIDLLTQELERFRTVGGDIGVDLDAIEVKTIGEFSATFAVIEHKLVELETLTEASAPLAKARAYLEAAFHEIGQHLTCGNMPESTPIPGTAAAAVAEEVSTAA
jgi:hypothetical protein